MDREEALEDLQEYRAYVFVAKIDVIANQNMILVSQYQAYVSYLQLLDKKRELYLLDLACSPALSSYFLQRQVSR